MRSLIVLVLICLCFPSKSLCWSFGGFDAKEILNMQEKAFQYGKACKRHDQLDSCSNFLDAFRKEVDLQIKYEKEINEGIAKGNGECQQIVHNAKIIFEMAVSLR